MIDSLLTGSPSSFSSRSNVTVSGDGAQTLLCAHGFCSNQGVFKHQVEAFRTTHRVVTYDLAGFGGSDPALWNAEHHASLDGYAEDMLQLINELGLQNVTLLGASMSAMIGVLASLRRPELFRALVFIGASPRYLDDGPYIGGFQQSGVDAFYDLVHSQQGWTGALTGMMLNQPVSLTLQEVAESVQGVRHEVAGVVARAIFQADYRHLLPEVSHPVLIMQTRADSVVPVSVGQFLRDNLPNSRLKFMPGVGHLPNLTAHEVFDQALRTFCQETEQSMYGSVLSITG